MLVRLTSAKLRFLQAEWRTSVVRDLRTEALMNMQGENPYAMKTQRKARNATLGALSCVFMA